MPNPVLTPKQADTPLDAGGNFTRRWYLYFESITGQISDLITNAVLGKPTLINPGAITKVTSAGTIGESRFTEDEIVGIVRKTQSQLSAFAATLTTQDTGLLVEVTDFRHVLRWTGSAWSWGPGEDGRHDIVALPVDPDNTTGWQLCDGTVTTYLKGDGTTGSFTTPNLSTAAYLKLGNSNSGPNAAVAPTFSGGSISNAATGVTASTGGPSVTVNVTTSGAVAVATGSHTHTVTVSDPTHTHTLSGGSIGSNGEPRNLQVKAYFRR